MMLFLLYYGNLLPSPLYTINSGYQLRGQFFKFVKMLLLRFMHLQLFSSRSICAVNIFLSIIMHPLDMMHLI